MRILQLTKFFPPFRGGIESAVYELAEGLAREGVDVKVLCCNDAPIRRVERDRAYGVTRVASLGRLLSTSMAPSLIAEVRRQLVGCDLVHMHMPDPMAALALWLARPQLPLVVHWHSDVIRQRLSMELYEPLQEWVLRRADAVVVTSAAYARASAPLQRWKHKVRIVPIGLSDMSAGVEPARAAALRARWRGRRTVFAVGRMAGYKGFDLLIDAAARLPEDVQVIIGGDGELHRALQERVAAAGLGGRVFLPGDLTSPELAAHFAACDVFCLPSNSRAESFGLAMVEAMACGRPVVASDIPGSGVTWINQADQTGLNVPVGSAAALADALQRVCDDPALAQRMGAAARRRYLQELTADRMTAKTLALYGELLGERLPEAAAPALHGPDRRQRARRM